jgi:hypothetical protein
VGIKERVNPSATTTPDLVQQLAMQLSMLLQQQIASNTPKNSGIIANFSNFSLKTQWVLDSSATDHITGNNELL